MTNLVFVHLKYLDGMEIIVLQVVVEVEVGIEGGLLII